MNDARRKLQERVARLIEQYDKSKWTRASTINETRSHYADRIIAAIQSTQPPMPQPDWNNAPEWAQWWAMDEDGVCRYWSHEPVKSSPWDGVGQWLEPDAEEHVKRLTIFHSRTWSTTLRKRPEADDE